MLMRFSLLPQQRTIDPLVMWTKTALRWKKGWLPSTAPWTTLASSTQTEKRGRKPKLLKGLDPCKAIGGKRNASHLRTTPRETRTTLASLIEPSSLFWNAWPPLTKKDVIDIAVPTQLIKLNKKCIYSTI